MKGWNSAHVLDGAAEREVGQGRFNPWGQSPWNYWGQSLWNFLT